MGKTSKPLTIVAIDDVALWEELDKLEKQGHTIIRMSSNMNFPQADIVLGPNAWRMDPAHRDYLPLAIKEARMLRYSHEDRHDKKKRAAIDDELDIEHELGTTSDGPGDS